MEENKERFELCSSCRDHGQMSFAISWGFDFVSEDILARTKKYQAQEEEQQGYFHRLVREKNTRVQKRTIESGWF